MQCSHDAATGLQDAAAGRSRSRRTLRRRRRSTRFPLTPYQLYRPPPTARRPHHSPLAARYNGRLPCLTCGTSAGKVFIHNPHERSITTGAAEAADEAAAAGLAGGDRDIRFLNINRQVTAMVAGSLDATYVHDVLVVGTSTNLLAYDVEQNADVFFKEVPDGVNAMAIGPMQEREGPLVFVGGNCSLQGYDKEGEEAYWTVCGDNVRCISFCDADGDGIDELLVGSDDYAIRMFMQVSSRWEGRGERGREAGDARGGFVLCPRLAQPRRPTA